jgi:DNA replication ATP-dependent helicase Dna2
LSDIRAGKDQSTKLAISGLHDTEEDIWSPRYGLKGKLDASVQVMLKETKGLWEQTKKTSMPFEIKTGMSKGGIEHRAQTMLYTLLMEERYGQSWLVALGVFNIVTDACIGTDVPAGLLYYTQSDEVIRVGAARNELRALIQNRNNMATHTMKRASNNKKAADDLMEIDFLPPTQDDERTCGRCYAVDGCMLYRKVIFTPISIYHLPNHLSQAVERVEDSNSEIQELYNYRTAHLTDAQCNFFKEWEELISLEEQESLRFRKQLWTMGAEQREKTGRCFANMVIASSPPSDVRPDAGPGASKIHRYTYTFLRKPPPQTRGSNLNSTSEPPAPFTRASSTMSILQKPFNPASSLTPSSPSAASSNSLLNGHLVVGDAVTISIEPNLLALARGFILQLFPQRVVVGLDHALDVDSLLARTNTKTSSHENDGKQSRVVFRIDKDEMTTGIGRIRNNLANLFYRGGDQRRLELVVDLKRPEFDDINNYLSWHKTGSASKSSRPVKSVLNESQRYAVAKALSARDYAILLGMPGTGKTTTIAEIIKELVKRGKTVLLSSYTHSAVDNILMKLSDVDFDILRLGNPDKVSIRFTELTPDVS